MKVLQHKACKAFNLIREAHAYPDAQFYGGPKSLHRLTGNYQNDRGGLYSQKGQDTIILEHFFQLLNEKSFPKIFLDVGCNHPIFHSNSLAFERHFGFKTIAVDALGEFKEDWRIHRQTATFITTAVGETNGRVVFDVVKGSTKQIMLSAVSGASPKTGAQETEQREVTLRPISELLEECGAAAIGIMSLDVEGYELQALRGIDFSRTPIKIVVLENNRHSGMADTSIRDFMKKQGYQLVARIFDLDDIFALT